MINPHDHQVYAVKELTNLTLEDGSTDEVAMHELLAEVRKMGVVGSQFIVQYRTSAVYGGRFYVMMDPIASWDAHSLSSRRCAREMTRNLIARARAAVILRSKEWTTATS